MGSEIRRLGCVFCLALSVALWPATAVCETLRFVFLADSRGNSFSEPINTPVLSTIIAHIGALSPRPAFVIFGGDMAYRGNINGMYMFQAWKDLFASLINAGIPLYTAIGNHELYYQHADTGFHLENQQQYQAVFAENPSNGPAGYEHLTYSFESPGGDAFFAVLDPYYLQADDPSPSLSGTIDAPQLAWLSAQVALTDATHKFLFIHTPYYYVSDANPPGDVECPCAADVSFTNLWTILDDNQFDFYACGHTHLYSRKTIDRSIPPNPQTSTPRPPWHNHVVQLLDGTSGAVVDAATPKVDAAAWHVHNRPDTYYFSVIDIDGRELTVTSYGGNTGAYTAIDSFTDGRTAVVPALSGWSTALCVLLFVLAIILISVRSKNIG